MGTNPRSSLYNRFSLCPSTVERVGGLPAACTSGVVVVCSFSCVCVLISPVTVASSRDIDESSSILSTLVGVSLIDAAIKRFDFIVLGLYLIRN